MCRDKTCRGGRRCPGETGQFAAARRRRQRAAYAAKTATRTIPAEATPDSNRPTPFTVPETLPQRVSQLRGTIRDGSTRTPEEWAELEAEVTTIGATIAQRALNGLPRDTERIEQLRAEKEAAAEAVKGSAEEAKRLVRLLKASEAPDERMALKQQHSAALASHSSKNEEYAAVFRRLRDAEATELQRMADAYRRELSAVRELGGTISHDGGGHAKAADALQQVMGHFPADWIAASNRAGGLRPKMSKRRAHYAEHSIVIRKVREGSTPPIEDTVDVSYHADGDEPDLSDPRWEGWVKTGRYRLRSKPREYEWAGPKYSVITATADEQPGVGRAKITEKLGDTIDPRTGRPKQLFRIRRRGDWQMETYAELTINPGNEKEVALHEFSHRCEDTNPAIGELSEAFVVRRTTGPDGERHQLIKYHDSRTERVRPDDFADAYIGKDYAKQNDNHRLHEVLSMGMESLFSGSCGGLAGLGDRRRDDDMRNFVLGLLATT